MNSEMKAPAPAPFMIEQLALCPRDPEAARRLLREMGSGPWTRDVVKARGDVFNQAASNTAELSFEYAMLQEANELELLDYREGNNWMGARPHSDPHRASHLGMHCAAGELEAWREFFLTRGIGVAQEVRTNSHTNPAIAETRRYNYVIFDTHAILGIDIKFIVRFNPDGSEYGA